MRFLFYAMGGGLGHLTRALAFSRAAQPRDHYVHILTNSPYATYLREQFGQQFASERITLDVLPADLEASVFRHRSRNFIQAAEWDALIVDTFPRGIGGELVELLNCSKPKFLVHRKLNPQYVNAMDLTSWCKRYDRLFIPGETASIPDCPQIFPTAPWLICDDSDLFPRDRAREICGLRSERPFVLILATGKRSEEEASARIAETLQDEFGDRAEIRFASPSGVRAERVGSLELWPVMRFLKGVDLLIGAGGYNTVHEARATGTPLLAVAQKRLYDCQRQRLRDDECVADMREMVNRVHQWLDCREGIEPQRGAKSHGSKNGTQEAVAEIELFCSELQST